MSEWTGKTFTYVVAKEPVPAIVQTLTHRVHGEVHVRRGSRLLDALNTEEPFLAVTNAVVYDRDGETVLYHARFLGLHKAHIVWVLPKADLSEPAEVDEEA